MANNWTYGIYDPDANQVKWGRSINPFDRIKSFKADRPNCQLVVILPDHSVELELHEMFDDKRQEGEWFAVDDEMLAFIEQAKLWQPTPPRALVDVVMPDPQIVEMPVPYVLLPQPKPEPETETEDEAWTMPPRLDLYTGVAFVAMSVLMIAGTIAALALSDWRIDLNIARWMITYPFMLGVGIHIVRRNAKRLA